MEGVGEIKEKIIEINHSEKSLTYKVVQSPVPLDHHLAKLQFWKIRIFLS